MAVFVCPNSTLVGAGSVFGFFASVTGATSNADVDWSVNGIAGGNTVVGLITSGEGYPGKYTAPTVVPKSNPVMISATSQADPTKSDSSLVTIKARLDVSATFLFNDLSSGSYLPVGESFQFGGVSVFGYDDSSLLWSVNGITGGNSTLGTISNTGLYTAPVNVPSPDKVTIAATSRADSNLSVSQGLYITQGSISISVDPRSATLQAGGSQQFTASVNGTTDAVVCWNVGGVPGGTSEFGVISAAGLYSAPRSPVAGAVTISAFVAPSSTSCSTAGALGQMGFTRVGRDPFSEFLNAVAATSATVAIAGVTGGGGGGTVAITSLSDTSPLPLAPLQISTTGLDTGTSGAPVQVQFSNGAGYAVSEQAIRVASDGTVLVGVPLYADPTSGQISEGTVSVVLTQGSQSSAAVTMDIQELPPLSTYGTQLGEISRTVLDFDARLLARRLNQLQAFQALPGNKIDTSQAQATLNTLLIAVIEVRQDVDQVSSDNTAVISNGTLPDGTPIQFDKDSLDFMDRVNALFLTETLATLPAAASSSANALRSPSAAMGSARIVSVSRIGRSTARPFFAGSRLFSTQWWTPVSLRGLASRSILASQAKSPLRNLVHLLNLMNSVKDGKDLAESAIKAQGAKDWIDIVEAAAKGTGVLFEQLPDKKTSLALGGAGAILSDARTVGDVFGDLGAYIDGMVTGNKALMGTAVQEMSDSRQDIYKAGIDLVLALAGQVEELATTSSMANFAKTSYELGDTAQADADSTAVALANEFPAPPPVDTQGIAYVTGMVNVPNNQGIGAPQSGIDLSSGGTTFNTLADPSGNYQLFVPLQASPFDYANADLTIVDPVTQTNLGSAVVDLSNLTTAAPLQIPTIQGTHVITSISMAMIQIVTEGSSG